MISDLLFSIQNDAVMEVSAITETRAMVLEPIHCPECDGIEVIKHGTTPDGKQRYFCQDSECSRHTFILHSSYLGYLPEVKQQISDMAVNGSGIRDTARVLQI